MTDNSMIPDSGNNESAPNERDVSCRVSFWKTQKDELTAHITPTTDYKRLVWNILCGIGERSLNERLMLDKECQIAERILEWLNDHPEYRHYRDAIKLIPYQNFMQLESTSTVHFNLWVNSNASLWISPRDASSSNDLLWQMALIRTSCFLNTQSFTPA